MATINFETTTTTFTVIVDGTTQGTWDRLDEVDEKYGVIAQDRSAVISLKNPGYTNIISDADEIQVNGVEQSGTFREKVQALKDDVFYLDQQVVMYKRRVTLTDDQIKSWPTTPVELIPAPGAGKAIICPMIYNAGVCMFITNLAVGYSNITFGSQIQFAIGDGSAIDAQYGGGSNFETLLAAGNKMWAIASDYFQVSGQSSSAAELENKALNVAITQNTDGNFTGGDPANTIELTVTYWIIDI